jgi:hypothetical protein
MPDYAGYIEHVKHDLKHVSSESWDPMPVFCCFLGNIGSSSCRGVHRDTSSRRGLMRMLHAFALRCRCCA